MNLINFIDHKLFTSVRYLDATVCVLQLGVLDKPLGRFNGAKVIVVRLVFSSCLIYARVSYSSPLDLDTWAEILVPDFYDRICHLFGVPDSTQEEEDEALAKVLRPERPSGLGLVKIFAMLFLPWCFNVYRKLQSIPIPMPIVNFCNNRLLLKCHSYSGQSLYGGIYLPHSSHNSKAYNYTRESF